MPCRVTGACTWEWSEQVEIMRDRPCIKIVRCLLVLMGEWVSLLEQFHGLTEN